MINPWHQTGVFDTTQEGQGDLAKAYPYAGHTKEEEEPIYLETTADLEEAIDEVIADTVAAQEASQEPTGAPESVSEPQPVGQDGVLIPVPNALDLFASELSPNPPPSQPEVSSFMAEKLDKPKAPKKKPVAKKNQ